MKYVNGMTGVEVEIPSLKIKDEGEDVSEPNYGEEYVCVENREDFLLLVNCMGWETVEQFEKDNGVTVEELLGKYWFTMGDKFRNGNRLYVL